jgi:hypothetical protein
MALTSTKGAYTSASLEIADFSASGGCLGRLIGRHNIAYRSLSGENRCVDSETVQDKAKVVTSVT